MISGAGAAGVAVAKILLEAGIKDLAVTDRKGVLHSSRGDLTPVKRALAAMTADQTGRTGTLADVLAGRRRLHRRLRRDRARGARRLDGAGLDHLRRSRTPTRRCTPTWHTGTPGSVATGRSDFPNQINNVLAFPGIFRGAFDCTRARSPRG